MMKPGLTGTGAGALGSGTPGTGAGALGSGTPGTGSGAGAGAAGWVAPGMTNAGWVAAGAGVGGADVVAGAVRRPAKNAAITSTMPPMMRPIVLPREDEGLAGEIGWAGPPIGARVVVAPGVNAPVMTDPGAGAVIGWMGAVAPMGGMPVLGGAAIAATGAVGGGAAAASGFWAGGSGTNGAGACGAAAGTAGAATAAATGATGWGATGWGATGAAAAGAAAAALLTARCTVHALPSQYWSWVGSSGAGYQPAWMSLMVRLSRMFHPSNQPTARLSCHLSRLMA